MTMRDCADAAMRDRLPLFVTGRLTDSDSTMVEAHLASCGDCVAEVELLRAVGRAYAVPAIDAAVVAAAIPAPRRKRTAYYQQPMWRVAAAMTLMIAGTAGVLVMRRADPGIMGSVAVGVDSSVGGGVVSAESTLAMAPTLPAGPATISFGGNLSDLTDAQLEALLAQIERIDGAVSAEPEVMTTSIPDAAGRRN